MEKARCRMERREMETEQKIDETIIFTCNRINTILGEGSTYEELGMAADLERALAELISARAEVAKLPRKACQ
jgi:hypothetical protein